MTLSQKYATGALYKVNDAFTVTVQTLAFMSGHHQRMPWTVAFSAVVWAPYKMMTSWQSGRAFQARAAATGNARSPNVICWVDGTRSADVELERKRQRDSTLDVSWRVSAVCVCALVCLSSQFSNDLYQTSHTGKHQASEELVQFCKSFASIPDFLKGFFDTAVLLILLAKLIASLWEFYRRCICGQDKDVRVKSGLDFLFNRSASAGPLLRSLHWLPVRQQRINFKLAKLCYLVTSFQQPDYLADLISPYSQSRSLRSSTQKFLSVPPHNLDTAARHFSVAAPRLWNSLPLNCRTAPSVDTFKIRLKIFLFVSA